MGLDTLRAEGAGEGLVPGGEILRSAQNDGWGGAGGADCARLVVKPI